jgi:hypothetical protein
MSLNHYAQVSDTHVPTFVTEKQVLGIWQDILRGGADLKTVDNESVRVIYPGRRNDDRGADFKDAIIATNRGQTRGDIEIHVKTSYWWTHRHHLDPSYNRVVLHVVYQHDTAGMIVLENGLSAPTLALDDYIGKSHEVSGVSAIPCHNMGYSNKIELIAIQLDTAGEARFLERASGYQKMIKELGAGQALYQGIMTALGYSKNKDSMAELSRLMPLGRLEVFASSEVSDDDYLARCQAYLIGAAGLLPLQRTEGCLAGEYIDAWEKKLENIWSTGGQSGRMSVNNWHFFRVRPGNYPVRRIAAMSHLLQRYRQKGLLAGLGDKFQRADSLEEALIVPPDRYWGHYMDFGIPSSGAPPVLLGKERAADIVINVWLPFFYARGLAKDREGVLEIYHNYRAPEENTLVKHMRQQLGISRFLINTARRQQGLIHIYKMYCLEGNCTGCPLI